MKTNSEKLNRGKGKWIYQLEVLIQVERNGASKILNIFFLWLRDKDSKSWGWFSRTWTTKYMSLVKCKKEEKWKMKWKIKIYKTLLIF